MNPQLGAALQNPQVRAMMSNPDFIRQMTDPATMQVRCDTLSVVTVFVRLAVLRRCE
jgi:hypothetical protein